MGIQHGNLCFDHGHLSEWRFPKWGTHIIQNYAILVPIGSMYGIYANIGGILMGSMLPYIAYMDPMGY